MLFVHPILLDENMNFLRSDEGSGQSNQREKEATIPLYRTYRIRFQEQYIEFQHK